MSNRSSHPKGNKQNTSENVIFTLSTYRRWTLYMHFSHTKGTAKTYCRRRRNVSTIGRYRSGSSTIVGFFIWEIRATEMATRSPKSCGFPFIRPQTEMQIEWFVYLLFIQQSSARKICLIIVWKSLWFVKLFLFSLSPCFAALRVILYCWVLLRLYTSQAYVTSFIYCWWLVIDIDMALALYTLWKAYQTKKIVWRRWLSSVMVSAIVRWEITPSESGFS